MNPPPAWIITIPTAILTAMLTWIVTEFCLKRWIRPKLAVGYDPDNGFCRVTFGDKASYLRLKVTNVRHAAAKSPRVYLMNVEIVEEGLTKPSGYHDVLPLSWPFESSPEANVPVKPRASTLPLLKDTPDYADICRHTENSRAMLGLLVDPYDKYRNLIQVGIVYRLTLQAVAEDASPIKTMLDLTWDGTPLGLTLSQVPPS